MSDVSASAQDKIVFYQIKFNSGSNSSVVLKRVRKGFSHHYRLRAMDGQTMTVLLKTGKQISLTIYAPTMGIIEGADGETSWQGILPESGEYIIAISTDVTANYKLEVSIK